MSLQIRRGLDADRTTITPLEGELLFTTDSQLLYVGDGATAGGISAGGALPAPFLVSGGGSSMFIGNNSGTQNEAGNNTAYGNNALANNLYSNNNTAIGADSLTQLGKITNADQVWVGAVYKIVDPGDTDWTAMGAPDNNPGTQFQVSAVGSGTGTAACANAERNTALGHQAGQSLETGFRNNYFGRGAGALVRTANSQCMFGQGAGFYDGGNMSVGIGRGSANTTGNNSVSIGAFSLERSGIIPGDALNVGDLYMIANPGSTDWTTAGASDNNEGTLFVATGNVTSYDGGWVRNMTNPVANNSIGIGFSAGSGDGSMFMSGDDNVFIGNNTKPLAQDDANSVVIGNGAVGIGSNSVAIGNTTTFTTKVMGKLMIGTAPSSSIGEDGDVAGMVAADADYLYHCTAAYDGSTSIWKRVAGSTW